MSPIFLESPIATPIIYPIIVLTTKEMVNICTVRHVYSGRSPSLLITIS